MELNNKVLYFAYGSNLLTSRLENRVGSVIEYGKYNLKGYSLTFNVNGFANIVKNNNAVVQGYLYVLDTDQLHTLSIYEGFYKPEFFIHDDQVCVVYVGLDYNMSSILPYKSYIELIIKGAIEKKLSTNLINKLKELHAISLDVRKVKHKRGGKSKHW